jgi:putative phosphoesterase
MRVLLLADIHSNWAALQAVDEALRSAGDAYDACLFLGDLVDYGTDPLPCIDWVRRHASVAIRGNHDHAVAQRVRSRGGTGLRRLAAATRPLHWSVIDPARNKYLARLPITRHLDLGGRTFYLVHATPHDPLDEYLIDDADLWRGRLRRIEADFVCVGHTHVPFHLDLGSTQVVNPGSIGQPRDGDPRASYAVIEDGQVRIHRVEYDIDAAVRQMRETEVEPWVVRLNEAILRKGGQLTAEEMDEFR